MSPQLVPNVIVYAVPEARVLLGAVGQDFASVRVAGASLHVPLADGVGVRGGGLAGPLRPRLEEPDDAAEHDGQRDDDPDDGVATTPLRRGSRATGLLPLVLGPRELAFAPAACHPWPPDTDRSARV